MIWWLEVRDMKICRASTGREATRLTIIFLTPPHVTYQIQPCIRCEDLIFFVLKKQKKKKKTRTKNETFVFIQIYTPRCIWSYVI